MHKRLYMILLFVFSCSGMAQASISSRPVHVLLLHSYNQRMTWVKNIQAAVEDVLSPGDNNIILHVEDMDSKEFYSPEYFDLYKKFLKHKYTGERLSLIMSSDNHALNFLGKNRDEVFPGTPVVFCGVNNFKAGLIKDNDNFTGVAEIPSIRKTVEIALTLHPGTREIFIVNDYLETGRAIQRDIQKALGDLKKKIQITYAPNLALAELKSTISNLHEKSIVLLGVYYADKEGTYFTFEKIGAMVSEASRVPVYCLYEFNIGTGVTGGEVISGYNQGQAMAMMGKQILNGTDPSILPVARREVNQIQFNYTQLKRFNIPESSLPKESKIINLPFSHLEKYQLEILITCAIIFFLAATVIFLIWNTLKLRKTENALSQRNLKHSKMIAGINDVIVIIDQGGINRYKSPSIEKLFGWKPEDVVDTSTWENIHPDDLNAVQQLLNQMMADSGKPLTIEYRYRCKNGRYSWVEFTGINLLDDPEICGILGNYHDITARKQTEEMLEQSRADLIETQHFLHKIIDSIADPIFVKNQQHQWVLVNESFCNFLGISQDALIGKSDYDVFPELEAHVFWKKDNEVFSNQQTNTSTESFTDVRGLTRTISTKKTLYMNDQREQFIVGIIRDISELIEHRKNLEKQVTCRTKDLNAANIELTCANRLKDEFLANMSHELRTPLTVVLGMTEALLEKVYGPLNDLQEKSLQTIENSGQYLLELINGILDLSKINAGKLELELGTVSIDAACQASLQMVKQAAYKKNQTVSLNIDSKKDLITADMMRLKQILVNLLTNSVKFTPEDGKLGIDVTVGQDGNRVEFTVWDTGIGIAGKDMDRLFTPFVQVDGSYARKHEGTGLGLSLVQKLAELHGGWVDIDSEKQKFTRVTVTLPLDSGIEAKKATVTEG